MVQGNRSRYRQAMKIHEFGYAMYEPETFDRLKPGSLGYFDKECKWHHLLDLTDAEAIAALNCTPFVAPKYRDPNIRHWDPLPSSDVSESSINLDAGVDMAAFGLPASVSFMTEYSTTTDFGAVLMCDDDVVEEGYDVQKPFELWIRKNKLALSKISELKEHGVVCSTWTYSSKSIHLNVWQNPKSVVRVGGTIGAVNTLNAKAQTEWVRGHSGSSWTDWPEDQRVVFFHGVKCMYRWLGRMTTKPESNWRGGEKFVVWDPETQDAFEGEIEFFGQDKESTENEDDEK